MAEIGSEFGYVGQVTNFSGGVGVVIADECVDQWLVVGEYVESSAF